MAKWLKLYAIIIIRQLIRRRNMSIVTTRAPIYTYTFPPNLTQVLAETKMQFFETRCTTHNEAVVAEDITLGNTTISLK